MRKRSDSLNLWKQKELLGDTLIKFVVADLFCKKFGNFQTNTHIPKIDLIVRNHNMIKIAKELGLIPHPEDVLEFTEYNIEKPYANAFEVHVYNIYTAYGLANVYTFIDQYLFTPEILEKVNKWHDKNVADEKARFEKKLARDIANPRKHKYLQHILNSKTDDN